MTPIDVSSYANNVTATTSGVGDALTSTILPAVLLLVAGCLAINTGWTLFRRMTGHGHHIVSGPGGTWEFDD